MSRPDNPRFPHWCTITRITNAGPMIDQPIFDDPMQDEVEDSVETEETPSEESEVTVIYKGICRAYDKNTTSDKGEVITSYRGLSIPMTREDWQRLGVVPKEGDRIVVDRGGNEEYGIVIDKNPSNFGGTHLVWRYGRN